MFQSWSFYLSNFKNLHSGALISILNCHKLNPQGPFPRARAVPLPTQPGALSHLQPSLASSIGHCRSLRAERSIGQNPKAKQFFSLFSWPKQHRMGSGLSQDWQNIKSNFLNCTQPAAKSMNYSGDMPSAVKITRQGKKKIYNSCQK